MSVHCWGKGRLREDGGGGTNQLALLTIVAQIPFGNRIAPCYARRDEPMISPTHLRLCYGAVGWALGAITATGPREGACRLMPR